MYIKWVKIAKCIISFTILYIVITLFKNSITLIDSTKPNIVHEFSIDIKILNYYILWNIIDVHKFPKWKKKIGNGSNQVSREVDLEKKKKRTQQYLDYQKRDLKLDKKG